MGYLGGRSVARSTHAGWMNEPFQRLSLLGLAGLAFAGAELVGGNGFIAAFVAGLTLGNTTRAVCARVYEFGEAEGQLLTLVVFLIVDGVMVPAALPHWDHRMWLYALASLSVVRMAPVALSLVRSGLRPATLAFVGWFGPRGLASILYARIVVGEDLPVSALLESIVTLTVLLSTLLHGITAYPLARRYATVNGSRRPATTPKRSTSPYPICRCASGTPRRRGRREPPGRLVVRHPRKPRATLIGDERRTCWRAGVAVSGGGACPAGAASSPLRPA